MTKLTKLHDACSKEPEYKKAYDSMQAEFELARQLIATRIKSGLTQGELAKKNGYVSICDCTVRERSRIAIHTYFAEICEGD